MIKNNQAQKFTFYYCTEKNYEIDQMSDHIKRLSLKCLK